MGDALPVTSHTAGDQSVPLVDQVDPDMTQIGQLASAQPRKFDGFSDSKSASRNKENLMRLDPTNFNPSPPFGPQDRYSRQDLVLFLFNQGRQNLIGLLLNTYPNLAQNSLMLSPAQQGQPSAKQASVSLYPSYYMNNPRDLISSASGIDPAATAARMRGDLIFLPPPVQQKAEQEAPLQLVPLAGSINGGPGLGSQPSSGGRQDSIFSQVIQMPRSSSNSVSGPSRKSKSIEYTEYEPWAKDGGLNSLGWAQEGSRDLKKLSIGYDPQGTFWDAMTSGLISGISSNNINAFLLNLLTSESADFSSMSNEQRRDSILKFLNDRNSKRLSSTTKLRENIFEKPTDKYVTVARDLHYLPTSSVSSKLLRHPDDGNSPKSSMANVDSSSKMPYSAVYPGDPYQYNLAPTGSEPKVEDLNYNSMSKPPRPPLRNLQAFSPPLFKGPQYAPQASSNYMYLDPKNAAPGADPNPEKYLMAAQQFARSEDGRPLLGATKVDQLMLVIQAREKGNTNAIQQAADGSILALPSNATDENGVLPQTVNLVGGVEKPSNVANEDDDDRERKKRRRRGKSQQCSFCSKQFNQLTHLEVHMRSHIGLKPFVCSYCNKRFTQGGNLRTHMRLHTGEKPFSCEVCHRLFSRKGNLAAHMLTHKKEKPFKCELDDCDKTFTQLGNLKSHQNKFHLPTLNRLTLQLANLNGQELDQLPEQQRKVLDYFSNLYKNSNKGIRGRGRGKRVPTISEMNQAIPQSGIAGLSPPQQYVPGGVKTMLASPHGAVNYLDAGLPPGAGVQYDDGDDAYQGDDYR